MHPAIAITTALAAVVGLALVSVTFSKNAQAPQVIQAAGSALGTVITAAVSPVTGGSTGLASSLGNYLTNPSGLSYAA